ncbi:MAG: hypothetical protein NC548_40095 [Lachnospiraceae bacterium]|nr:hypothetical protein [Lachnospiraceae bacterium]MCM1230875.1 hypothetical protein [Ruminococcus flavefaciens]
MSDIKFADSYEFNMEKIHEMLISHIINNENFSYFCKEDEERMNALSERLNNIMALDVGFKKEFISDLRITTDYVSINSFENGLRIGLSLLKSLLTAEMPEIHIVHHIPSEIEKKYTPVQQQSELNPKFLEYTEKILPYLTDEQKYQLQGRMEFFLDENIKKHLNLF